MPCPWCQRAVIARAGAMFCSDYCRVASNRQRHRIPSELRARDRWVRHSSSKIPLTILGNAASSTDATTWSSFDEAFASSAGTGMGFVLNGDGIVCIDLDEAIDQRGRVLPWARSIMSLFPPTYVEVSPSGRGLHVWGFGHVDRGRRFGDDDVGIEVYGRGRYLTVTGRRVRGCSTGLSDLGNACRIVEDAWHSGAVLRSQ